MEIGFCNLMIFHWHNLFVSTVTIPNKLSQTRQEPCSDKSFKVCAQQQQESCPVFWLSTTKRITDIDWQTGRWKVTKPWVWKKTQVHVHCLNEVRRHYRPFSHKSYLCFIVDCCKHLHKLSLYFFSKAGCHMSRLTMTTVPGYVSLQH